MCWHSLHHLEEGQCCVVCTQQTPAWMLCPLLTSVLSWLWHVHVDRGSVRSSSLPVISRLTHKLTECMSPNVTNLFTVSLFLSRHIPLPWLKTLDLPGPWTKFLIPVIQTTLDLEGQGFLKLWGTQILSAFHLSHPQDLLSQPLILVIWVLRVHRYSCFSIRLYQAPNISKNLFLK